MAVLETTRQLLRMRRDWERRARENARHYVVTGQSQWNDEEFYRSGMITLEEEILDDLPNICQDKDPKQMRILEIGCGTGLLLYRLVPHCAQYCGTDLSPAAIGQLKASQKRLGIAGLDRAELREQQADDFTGFDPEGFDTIVLNSVVQYFPSIDYLLEVLRKAVGHCADGGAIFIGDVRSLSSLRAYHTSVQCFKAEDSITRDELTQRIETQMLREQELAIAPEFFQALRHHLSRVSGATIRPKRGWQHNEMTRFRYDVVLQVEASQSLTHCPPEVWQDWRSSCQDLAAIRAHLGTAQPEYWGLRHVSSTRLETELRVRQWLAEAAPTATVHELRKWLAQPAGPAPAASGGGQCRPGRRRPR